FTVTGCPKLDLDPFRCIGRPPLELTFVPITAGVNRYLWDFGDGTAKSSEEAPTHGFPIPGAYDITLVGGGPGGSALKTRTGFVNVTKNTTADPCDVDAQCESALMCLCGSAGQCPAAFSRGICTSFCADKPCRETEVCADLSVAARPGVPAALWQQKL